ncbi:MAG: hypothetical protein R3D57_04505 [Hyphomicrobiaceae bacterium]
MHVNQSMQAFARLTAAGVDLLGYLAIRFGIASLPMDLLLNCDDVIYAAFALST